MKHRITYFSLFLSVVMGLIVGVYKFPLMTNILFFITFFFLVIFSYRIYLLIEKLGVYLHEKYFRKIFENIKKAKETIQE